jgi:hypothetical protein
MATLTVKFDVWPLRSAAGSVKKVTFARLSARPLTSTRTGSNVIPVSE